MATRKEVQRTIAPASTPSANPAYRQRVDYVRRKAQQCTDLTEQTGNQNHDQRRASQQRKQAEREMANLRAEAVHARRLANQIKNLHQPARVQQKGRIMSTTIADPGQAQRMSRRGTDNPPTAGRRLSFNPLHPSMELPPEQLIRLLGLENMKKRRKKRPAQAPVCTGEKQTANEKPAARSIKLALPVTPPRSAERERDNISPPFGAPRRNLLATSLIVGVIAGIGLSAYLFWISPEDAVATVTQTAPVSKTTRTAPATPSVSRKKQPAARPSAALEETSRQGTVTRTSIISPARIEAEEQRLRNEAASRFSERMIQQDLEQSKTDTIPPNETETTLGASPATPFNAEKTDIGAESAPTAGDPVEAGVIQEDFSKEPAGEALF